MQTRLRHLLGHLLLATVAAAGAGSAIAASSSSAPIPWLDDPLPLYHLPAPKVIPYQTNAPPCDAAVVHVRQGRSGAATGHLLDELVFTNTGSKPCLLRGYPRVEAEGPSGAHVLLHPRRGTFFGPLAPARLAPRGHSFLDFETDDVCANGTRKPTHYQNVRFTLPAGGRVSSGITLTVVCGLAMSSFGLKPRYTGTHAAAGTAGALHAQVELPASVKRGSTFNYTVTLDNPTRQTIRFTTTCPGYTHGVYTTAASMRGSYRLNCAPVASLPPHASATFAMKLRVPRRAALGLAKVGWNLDTPTGPFAAGTITVER